MDSQPAVASPARRGFSRIHLIVLLAMVGVLGMLAWTTWSARALVLTFVPQVNATMASRIAVTEAHLWLEEIVSGDASEDPQQVWDRIADARWYLDAMLEGDERDGRRYVAVADDVLREDLLKARSVLGEFEALARTRVDAARAPPVPSVESVAPAGDLSADEATPAEGEPPAPAAVVAPAAPEVGVGSDIDQRFDDTFNAFFVATQRAEEHLHEVIARALAVFIGTQLALMAAVAGVFGWIVWLLVRKEATDRDSHVRSLQASLDGLAASRLALERQNALRGAMVEISDALQGIADPATIARVALDVLCARSGATVGVCWGYVPGQGLSRLAAHALPQERAEVDFLADGEGLAGRAAQDQQPLLVDVPSDYLQITSGLGASAAPHLRVLPLVHDRVTSGVLELAFIERPDEYVSELLESAAPAIAVRLQMANRAVQGG